MRSAVRIQPPTRPRCGDYILDRFVVELHDGVLDFRLELGMDLAIYWAVPAGDGDRLRLAMVDGAAFHVDEPVLEADPFVFDLARTEWRGELGELHDGTIVVHAVFEASAIPPAYRCEIGLRSPSGEIRTTQFAWAAPLPRPPRPQTAEDKARTDALIDGLIDAYYEWDAPERVAAREAREAASARRTAEVFALTAAPATPAQRELLDACRAAPDDDTPRLAWARTVGGERGELVVLQCELARGGLSYDDTMKRRRRVRDLLDRHGAAWSGLTGLATAVRFDRGFVDAAELAAADWFEHANAIREAAPLLSTLRPFVGEGEACALADLDRLLLDPAILALDALDLTAVRFEVVDDDGPNWWQSLTDAAVPRLPRLRGLAIGEVEPATLRALGERDLTRLEVLHVYCERANNEHWAQLLSPERVPALRALLLDVSRYVRFDLTRLLDALPPTLTELGFVSLSTASFTKLAEHPLAQRLERLRIHGDSLGNTHLLASFPRLRSLSCAHAYGQLVSELTPSTMPALRELACFASASLADIASIVERFGAQLELLDLRGLDPYGRLGSDADVAHRLASATRRMSGIVVGRDATPSTSLLDLSRARESPYWAEVRP